MIGKKVRAILIAADMEIEIIEENLNALDDYQKISIAFKVEKQFKIERLGESFLEGFKFIEEPVETPYFKDYDAFESERPASWAKKWDISNWGIITARAAKNNERIGGAAIAWKTPEIHMLEGRDDLACLWDLRVCPEFRGKGVGRRLFDYAVQWSQRRLCRQINVETQNTNVAACRFYQSQGCELGGFNKFAYDESLKEIQFLWYKNIK